MTGSCHQYDYIGHEDTNQTEATSQASCPELHLYFQVQGPKRIPWPVSQERSFLKQGKWWLEGWLAKIHEEFLVVT